MSRPNRHVPQLTRRQVMRLAAAGALGASASGWIEALAADTAAHPNRRKSCILLWMSGGPSQTDTFDPKPGHANSGPFKPIADGRAGDAARPALAEARPAGQGPRHHPLDELQGRGPRPGHLLPPDRLPAPGAGPLPDARLAGCQRVRRRVGRAARVRQHLAGPGDQCGRVQLGLPGPEVRTAERRRAEPGRRRGRRDALRCGSRISTSRAASAARGPTSGSS